MTPAAVRLAVLTTSLLTLFAAPAAASSFSTVAGQQDSLRSAGVSALATVPSRPHIGTASSGDIGGILNATARWSAPPSDGGAAITKYQVIAQKLNASDKVVAAYRSIYKGPKARGLAMTLPSGRYQFRVQAWNSVGASVPSPQSNFVTSR